MQRDNWGKWAMSVALALVIIAGVALVMSLSTRKAMVSIGSQVVHVRIADTDKSREKGLSGTSGLGENEGMLFIFAVPGRWGLWMKDMKYSIDMLWLDGNKKIIYKVENVSPDTFPKVFLPDKDARYVLELPAGFSSKNQVSLGQVVGFTAD
jgi:uncharacterized membrane protein (UPF0127 family)